MTRNRTQISVPGEDGGSGEQGEAVHGRVSLLVNRPKARGESRGVESKAAILRVDGYRMRR